MLCEIDWCPSCVSRLCVGKATKTNHYWRNRDGSLLLRAFKGEWERKKKKKKEGGREGGGQVHVSSCKKPEGIINRASVSPATLSLEIGPDLSSSWVWNDKVVWCWIRAKVVVLHSAAVIYMYCIYVIRFSGLLRQKEADVNHPIC